MALLFSNLNVFWCGKTLRWLTIVCPCESQMTLHQTLSGTKRKRDSEDTAVSKIIGHEPDVWPPLAVRLDTAKFQQRISEGKFTAAGVFASSRVLDCSKVWIDNPDYISCIYQLMIADAKHAAAISRLFGIVRSNGGFTAHTLTGGPKSKDTVGRLQPGIASCALTEVNNIEQARLMVVGASISGIVFSFAIAYELSKLSCTIVSDKELDVFDEMMVTVVQLMPVEGYCEETEHAGTLFESLRHACATSACETMFRRCPSLPLYSRTLHWQTDPHDAIDIKPKRTLKMKQLFEHQTTWQWEYIAPVVKASLIGDSESAQLLVPELAMIVIRYAFLLPAQTVTFCAAPAH